MRKFTLIFIKILLSVLFAQNLNAQYPDYGYYEPCHKPVNISDSLEIVELFGVFERPEWAYSSIQLIDTLDECRVVAVHADVTDNFSFNAQMNLPFLKFLSFYNLNMPGLDAIEYNNLPSLEVLSFTSGRYDTPEIPDFDIPTLKELYIYEPVFINSEIPDFSKMPELRVLSIYGNGPSHPIHGSIPNFSYLNKLEELYIGKTEISGEFPNLNNLPNLKRLSLRDNDLSGNIPDFDQFPLLEILDLSKSQFEGTIPDFTSIPFLKELALYENQLTGVIPDFSNLPLLEKFDICDDPFSFGLDTESNDFIGPIPNLENCPLLNTNDVNFTCVRPAPVNTGCPISESDSLELVNFYQATNGDNWRINGGWLTENMTSWWGIDLIDTLGECRVNQILIRGINDEVELPALNLPFLERLTLDYNSFTGNIPDLSNLTNLKILNLGANNFTGPLPDLSNLTLLEIINLSQNELDNIIVGYPNQPNLLVLDLSGNQLTGELPNFDDNTQLLQLNVSSNLLTGTIPDFQNIPNLRYLNISGNQLTGAIPDFTNLSNLYTLNVADSQLTGELPNFSNLPTLESLFVQGNQLTGRIPNFTNLSSLEELIVCDNNFEGTPPNFSSSSLLNVEAIDFGCLQSAKVSGYVYYDANENCVYDADDITIPNGLISINNGTNYQPIDENGYYEIALEVGTNLITFIQTSPLWQSSCEDTHTITSLTINDVAEIDFANQPTISCTQLTVDIGTPFLRRCFKNTYTVQYCNEGSQPAVDAFVEIELEPELIPLSASIPYEADNNLLTFQLGEVGIGECGSFTVVDSVACDAPLSSTGCVEAHIYPDEFCFLPATTWDGANLSVNAFCLENDSIQFIIENLGDNMNTSTIYKTYVEDLIAVQGEVQLTGSAAKVLTYPANGSTYRVAVEQTPGHPSLDDAQAFFEFCGDGNFTTGFINSQLLPDRDPFIDIDCGEIIGSYDPNDKLVSPAGVGDRYDVYESDELTYKIRFQNTGNDTAFTVVLVDTLDTEHLDISSLEVLSSSHNYTLSIEDAQVLTFTFNDILLVDSTANEQASHGFVTFKINQNQNNQIGDIIKNKAYIYFDYNEAIVTPTVFNTVAQPRLAANVEPNPLPVGIENQTLNNPFVKVYPNPVSDVFYVELPDAVINQQLQLEIYNIQGQSLQKHSLNKTEESITVSDLNSGIYYYRLFKDDLAIANGKLLIE